MYRVYLTGTNPYLAGHCMAERLSEEKSIIQGGGGGLDEALAA